MRGANLRGYGDSGGVTLIAYEGEVVASVGARRVYLAPQVDTLDDGEPLILSLIHI